MSAEERAKKRAADDVAFRAALARRERRAGQRRPRAVCHHREDYGDIELRLEYRTVAKADSGIYLRGTPQVQIWDTTEAGGKWKQGADKGSGGLWNNSPGAPGKDPLDARRQAVRRVEHASASCRPANGRGCGSTAS